MAKRDSLKAEATLLAIFWGESEEKSQLGRLHYNLVELM